MDYAKSYRVLDHLKVYGATRVKRLQEMLHLSERTINQLMRDMERAGLIRVEVRREFDRQTGEVARQGLFGGTGAMVRFRRYAVRINPEGDALAPEPR
jgi:hypothetical protein